MFFENYKMRKHHNGGDCTSNAAHSQQLRSWTVTLHHTKQVSAEHDPPATSSPWSTSCHGSGPCHGSWWGSSCPEHPRRWVWTYGRPPHRSAGQQGSPHTRAPWDHLRRFLKDGRRCTEVRRQQWWVAITGHTNYMSSINTNLFTTLNITIFKFILVLLETDLYIKTCVQRLAGV